MTRTFFIPAALALAVTLPAAPAEAGAPRTFLSAAGSDANNCTNVATPCRHMAAAFAATAADGEIYVLDPANYGSLTITHGVSIEGHGWASIAPVSGSAAITINANPGDKINIIGVVLDGTALVNTKGIVFNSGGTLSVQDSVIRNFTATGIEFQPNSSTLNELFVSNTLVSDNGNDGIEIFLSSSGTTKGVLDHVKLVSNQGRGLHVDNGGGGTVYITLTDSVSASNGSGGVFCDSNGTSANVMVRNSTIANNASSGLGAQGLGASIRATRSTITGNDTGWSQQLSTQVTSYDDNNIEDNGSVNNAPTQIIYK
jgi:hypothetical protein